MPASRRLFVARTSWSLTARWERARNSGFTAQNNSLAMCPPKVVEGSLEHINLAGNPRLDMITGKITGDTELIASSLRLHRTTRSSQRVLSCIDTPRISRRATEQAPRTAAGARDEDRLTLKRRYSRRAAARPRARGGRARGPRARTRARPSLGDYSAFARGDDTKSVGLLREQASRAARSQGRRFSASDALSRRRWGARPADGHRACARANGARLAQPSSDGGSIGPASWTTCPRRAARPQFLA